MSILSRTPESIYLEWLNEWLTIEKMADHYKINPKQLTKIIDSVKNQTIKNMKTTTPLNDANALMHSFITNFTLQHFMNLDDDQSVERYDQMYNDFEKYVIHEYYSNLEILKFDDVTIEFLKGLKDVLTEIATDIDGDLEDNVYELSIFILELHKYKQPTNKKLCKHFGLE